MTIMTIVIVIIIIIVIIMIMTSHTAIIYSIITVDQLLTDTLVLL